VIGWWLSFAMASPWLLHETLVAEVKPPVFFKWTESRTELWSIVIWEPGSDVFRAQLCALEGAPVMGTRTTWSRDRIANTAERVRPVAFDGQTFVSGPVTETIGLDDDDRDGEPGISIEVSHPRIGTGQVFVTQTVDLAWRGVLGPDGRITGTVDYRSEQAQLGATTWWLKKPLAMRDAAVERSTFELSPLPEGTTCAMVGGSADRPAL
jgi:hypothetical protein